MISVTHKGEDFYELYAQSVYRYLFSLIGEADTAEELTQETFYQALKSIDTYRGESPPPSVAMCDCQKIMV
ncbi:MAG: RNA polymerase sigma factor [Brotaphodocola sp.]